MSHAFVTAQPAPRVFAHRGWHVGDLAGCENSLAAFRRAVAEGISYLETDVHLTSDGVVVAFHDDRLDRVTDAAGPIARRSYSELRDVRIGGKEPIPTMAEVLEHCPDARFNIDPKSDEVVGPLLDLLREGSVIDRVCVGSFSSARLSTLRAAAGPRLATSLGPREVARAMGAARIGRRITARGAIAAQVPLRFRRVQVVTPRFINAMHRSGLEVHVWTINDRDAMERLLDLGVDGIVTDRPDLLRDLLAARGQWQ